MEIKTLFIMIICVYIYNFLLDFPFIDIVFELKGRVYLEERVV